MLLTTAMFSGSATAQQAAAVDAPPYKIISAGGTAGDYQAFPDACRLRNGDIVAVFYAGEAHVTYPSEKFPKSGRICLVRSKDEGRTWSTPVTIYDDSIDNRDPHISQMNDGTLVCTFFNLHFGKPVPARTGDFAYYSKTVQRERLGGDGPEFIRSFDNGRTWETKPTVAASREWNCSSKMRQLPDGTWLFPVYSGKGKIAWGGTIRSTDKGKTWEAPVPIGEEVQRYLPAETDIVQLKDGRLYAALRGSDHDSARMHYATSADGGKSWSPAKDIGFLAHSPAFTRLKNGAILLTVRAFPEGVHGNEGYTGLRISYDEAATWDGPYLIDKPKGAYPSTVELKDHTVLAVYYEEGQSSHIRALRFRLPPRPTSKIPEDSPRPLPYLPLD